MLNSLFKKHPHLTLLSVLIVSVISILAPGLLLDSSGTVVLTQIIPLVVFIMLYLIHLEENIPPPSHPLYILSITAFTVTPALILASGLVLHKPLTQLSGVEINKPFNPEQIIKDVNLSTSIPGRYYAFTDDTQPELTVHVFTDENNIVYKISNEFNFSSYPDEHKMYLKDILQARVFNELGTYRFFGWHTHDAFDGENAIIFARTPNSATVDLVNVEQAKVNKLYSQLAGVHQLHTKVDRIFN